MSPTYQNKPEYCDLILLDNCMLRCKMCNMWQSKQDPKQVPAQFYKRFVNSLFAAFGSDMQIQFVGGEPLLKPGVFKLIEHTVKKGFSTTLTSNGFLINKNVAAKLADSGLKSLAISIDSTEESVHNFLRGNVKAFKRAKKAIEYFSKYKAKEQSVSVVCTIMQINLDDLVNLVESVQENENIASISFQSVSQPFFTPPDENWFKKSEYSFLWPSDISKLRNTIERLIDLKMRKKKIANSIEQLKSYKYYFENPIESIKHNGCHLGYNSLSVNSAGDMYLCFDHAPIGNIMHDRVKDVWESERANRVRGKIKMCNRNCKSMLNCFSEQGFKV